MLRRILFGLSVPAMALGALLMSSAPTFAQRHGGGHGGGGHGGGWGGHGGGWGGGYHGGGWGGYRGGWGGYGWGGRGWDRGFGGFGLGYGLGYLSGSWGYPGYGYGGLGYDYYPSYAYSYPSYGVYDYGTPIYSYPTYGYGYAEQPGVVVQEPSMTQYSSAYGPGFNNGEFAQPAQERNTVSIDVRVPPNAQVWFDGTPTHETGAMRQFVSPPLQPGQQYSYTIRARWMQNGRPVDMTKRIQVAANQQRTVDFLAPSSNAAEPNMPPANFAPNTNLPPANAPLNANVPPANLPDNANDPPAPNANQFQNPPPAPNANQFQNPPPAPNAGQLQNNQPAPEPNHNAQPAPAPRKTPVP